MESNIELVGSNVAELSKKGIMSFASEIVENAIDPMKQLAVVSKVQLLCKELEAGLKKSCLNEIQTYEGQKTNILGVEFAQAEVGTKYDYSASPIWSELEEKIVSLKAQQKEHEDFLKALKSKTQILTDDGEVIELFPPAKSSSTSIKLTIK
jgi:hypothetical protein